jgi:hypothetical protein
VRTNKDRLDADFLTPSEQLNKSGLACRAGTMELEVSLAVDRDALAAMEIEGDEKVRRA